MNKKIPTKKLSTAKKAAAIAAAGLIVTATGVYVSKHTLEDRWKLYSITQVIDGDTFVVDQDSKVRLLGLDSPEKGQCYFDESRQAVAKFLTGKSVYLEKEISGEDEFGRLLRYAFLPAAGEKDDNLLINDYIIRQGWAQAKPIAPDSRYRVLLSSAQEEAVKGNKGLWENCAYKDGLSTRNEREDPPPGPAYVIKGNISGSGFGMTYLTPGCDNYNNVKIDFSKGEQYFKTEKAAQSAGFKKATNCP